MIFPASPLALAPSLARSFVLPAFSEEMIKGINSADYGRRVYMDFDTECLHPSEHVFDEFTMPRRRPLKTALIGRMDSDANFEHSIPNAWMASSPGHPFFLVLPAHVDRRVRESTSDDDPEHLTGPVALRDAIARYEKEKVRDGDELGVEIRGIRERYPLEPSRHADHQVVLLPGDVIYPYSWWRDGEPYRDICWVLKDAFNASLCKEKLEVERKESACITYWSHSHSPQGTNEENIKHIYR